MKIGTKLIADTAAAKAKHLYCGELVDGEIYVIDEINEHGGTHFFSVDGIENHEWSIEPDRDGDSHKQFFKVLEV